ncbi:glycosyltransferase family 4 protein [Tsuneonella sp. SYSU-LHT278]|uniref:glycosyltransferase family 4 protein n=1 Tax=Tsuneonella sediminis TaxID=3416089 RepID=UPI003F7909C4
MTTRVAIVLPELLPMPPVHGGAVEHWVEEVVRRYLRDGVEITIFSRPAGVAGQPGVHYVGIPWTTTEKRAKALRDRLGGRNPLRPLLKIQNVWSYGRRVVRQLDGFDIVCIQNEPNLLAMVRKRAGQRLVLHMHNDHLISRPLRLLYARALSKADRIICVSDYIRKRAVAAFPKHEGRFGVVINGTDPDTFKPLGSDDAGGAAALLETLHGKGVIFYAGRLVEQKGVHVLIAAFRTLAASNPAATLVIAGSSFFDGAAVTAYQRRLAASAAAVGDRIVFTGFVPHGTLKHLYARADAIVLPSIWNEPCSLTVIEGMASGSAVVATRVGGNPELVVDGETGLLVPPDDAPALLAAMRGLIDNPERRAALGAAARARVIAQLNWDRVARDFARELEGRG